MKLIEHEPVVQRLYTLENDMGIKTDYLYDNDGVLYYRAHDMCGNSWWEELKESDRHPGSQRLRKWFFDALIESRREALANMISCTCYDETSRRLCRNKNNCVKIEAQ